MRPPLLVGDATGRVRQIHTTEELTDLDRPLLERGRDATSHGRSLRDRVDDADTTAGVSSDKLVEPAEWTYKNVEEVWSGFNLIADAVGKGARVRGHDAAVQWGDAIDVQEKVRTIVINALVYGTCVVEAGQGFLKVRNPRTLETEQDEAGRISSAGIIRRGYAPAGLESVRLGGELADLSEPRERSAPTGCALRPLRLARAQKGWGSPGSAARYVDQPS